jgi:hypothetical protein
MRCRQTSHPASHQLSFRNFSWREFATKDLSRCDLAEHSDAWGVSIGSDLEAEPEERARAFLVLIADDLMACTITKDSIFRRELVSAERV